MVVFDTKKDNYLLLFKKHHPSMRSVLLDALLSPHLLRGLWPEE